MRTWRTVVFLLMQAAYFEVDCPGQALAPETLRFPVRENLAGRPPLPAEKLMLERRFGEAREAFLQELRVAEEGRGGRARLSFALEGLGTVELLVGRPRAALRYFERLVQTWEGVPQQQARALNSVGETLFVLGETTRAQKTLRHSLELFPGSGRPWHLLGQISIAAGHLREAEEALRRALQLAGADEVPLIAIMKNDLAIVYEQTKRYPEAIELLEQAMASVSHRHVRARITANLGSLQWQAGRREKAIESFQRAKDEMEAVVGRGHADVERIVVAYAQALREMGRKKEAKAMEAGLVSGLR